eukprot:m51a1_g13906 hypothetical protein (181) ;mRNA; r:760744-761616
MEDQTRSELMRAHQLVRDGRPTQALEIVLNLLRQRYNGDERQVFRAISLAKERYADNAEAEKLSEEMKVLSLCRDSLLSARNNAEPTPSSVPPQVIEALCSLKDGSRALLAHHGREQILGDALADGSSVVCRRCGELISADRTEQHTRFWCTQSNTEGSDMEVEAPAEAIPNSILRGSAQ